MKMYVKIGLLVAMGMLSTQVVQAADVKVAKSVEEILGDKENREKVYQVAELLSRGTLAAIGYCRDNVDGITLGPKLYRNEHYLGFEVKPNTSQCTSAQWIHIDRTGINKGSDGSMKGSLILKMSSPIEESKGYVYTAATEITKTITWDDTQSACLKPKNETASKTQRTLTLLGKTLGVAAALGGTILAYNKKDAIKKAATQLVQKATKKVAVMLPTYMPA